MPGRIRKTRSKVVPGLAIAGTCAGRTSPRACWPSTTRTIARPGRLRAGLADPTRHDRGAHQPRHRAAGLATPGRLGRLTLALKDRRRRTRALFIRARAFQRLGDLEAAARPRRGAPTRAPRRGELARPRGASGPSRFLRGDDRLRAALRLNPRSSATLRDMAAVLSEHLVARGGDPGARYGRSSCRPALPVAGGPRRAPGPPRPTRRGHRDARAALAAKHQAEQTYQAACVYALTSRRDPGDRARPSAWSPRPSVEDPKWFSILPQDHDLDPIRDTPEFRSWSRPSYCLPYPFPFESEIPTAGPSN